MRSLLANAVRAGLLLAAMVQGAAAAERLAQLPPSSIPDAGLPATTPPPATVALEDKVATFVADFYLSGDRRSEEELAQLYATKVAYFGNQVWSRERVLADKRAYYAKWPKRDYKLIRETLRVEKDPNRPRVLDVTFEYDFDVASSGRVSRGRGRSMLTLDLGQDGGRITRETGSVLRRW